MQHRAWWKDAVIYHIYPRSFYDANGDGIGDLRGIIQKLSHVRDLGANALCMGPGFRSPQVDNRYDIADYRDIHPRFGDIADMDELIDTAHAMGIRVLLDLVFNHTSDRHRWFRSSVADPDGPEGDFYIWRDPAPDGGPPNNWQAFFSVPAWTFSPERGQYYLHLFAPEQPDLNWENPRVREELAEVANFWLARGVDGFRMDVINVISKRPGLPSSPDGSRYGYFIDGPNVLAYLREFRSRLVSDREIVLVGETPGVTPEAARAYTDPANKALDMVLNFDHVMLDHGPGGRWDPRPLRIRAMRSVIEEWQRTLSAPCWPSLYMSNHDQPRVVSRYGNDRDYRFESATALATVFYLQRGTPIVYQGDEIAMTNYPLENHDEIVDIESRNAYLHLTREHGVGADEAFARVKSNARDHGRTPMQWSAEPHAGFMAQARQTADAHGSPARARAGDTATGREPWYPPNPDFHRSNVAAQDVCAPAGWQGADSRAAAPAPGVAERSVLCYYRRLLELRRERAALARGAFTLLSAATSAHGEAGDSAVVAFARTTEAGERITVAANLSDREHRWHAPAEVGTPVLTNYLPDGRSPAGALPVLRPWECVVLPG